MGSEPLDTLRYGRRDGRVSGGRGVVFQHEGEGGGALGWGCGIIIIIIIIIIAISRHFLRVEVLVWHYVLIMTFLLLLLLLLLLLHHEYKGVYVFGGKL